MVDDIVVPVELSDDFRLPLSNLLTSSSNQL